MLLIEITEPKKFAGIRAALKQVLNDPKLVKQPDIPVQELGDLPAVFKNLPVTDGQVSRRAFMQEVGTFLGRRFIPKYLIKLAAGTATKAVIKDIAQKVIKAQLEPRKRKERKVGVKEIVNAQGFRAFEILTAKAAHRYASGTSWDTADARWFDEYHKQGPLYGITVRSNGTELRYQLHPKTDTFIDAFGNENPKKIAQAFPDEWKKFLDYLKQEHQSSKFLTKPEVSPALQGVKLIVSEGGFKAVQLETAEAARRWATGTAWEFKEARLFDFYDKRGPIFVISLTSRGIARKFACHPASKLLVTDHGVKLTDHDVGVLFGSLPGWKKFLDYLIKHRYQ